MAKKSGPGGSAPKGGMQPKQKPAMAQDNRAKKISRGAPAKATGSDTSPYSSAAKNKR